MSSSNKIPKNLSEDQINFWLANTSLTKDELIEWYKTFQDFATKNAKLDKENFSKYFAKLHYKNKNTNSETFVNLLFKAFDKDNSGTVDFNEFLLAFNVLSDGELKKRLEWMFDVYDINNDGVIDRKEIETIIKAILKVSKKQLVGDQTNAAKIDEIFEKLDDNENEKVSKEEFVSNCSNNVFLRDILVPQV